MNLSLPRLLLSALAAACLLPASPAAAGGDLWGGSADGGEPAHATRAERIQAVAAADRAARPEPARRGSFVIVDGPTVSSFGGTRFRGNLHDRAQAHAEGRLRAGGLRSLHTSFGHADRPGEVIVRGNTGGLILSVPEGRHGYDRSGRYSRDAFVFPLEDRRTDRGPFLRHRGSTSFDRGFGGSAFDRGFGDSSYDRGFRRGFDAGSRGVLRRGIDRGASVEFRFGDR